MSDVVLGVSIIAFGTFAIATRKMIQNSWMMNSKEPPGMIDQIMRIVIGVIFIAKGVHLIILGILS